MSMHSFQAWIEVSEVRLEAKYRLFCFPYGGGSSALYHPWSQFLPKEIELCAIALPGRGRRLEEKPYKELREVLAPLAQAIASYEDKPFLFFGHSMGALMSFELARELRRQGRREPSLLCFSAFGAPQTRVPKRNLHLLPDDLFLKELERLKGTPQEVLAHQELMQLFLPVIRADLQMVETYTYLQEPPLDSAIVAFGGTEDEEVAVEALRGWAEHTRSSFSLHLFPGDHFFIHSRRALALIIEKILTELSRLAL